MWGSACLKSYPKTQATIAQSSAESELIAVVRAACEGLGMIALADDFGIELQVRLHIDASAALGILQRQGVGRVRHLDVGVLWLQEQQLKRLIELTKVSGTQNPADLMTKNLAKEQIDQYTKMLGFEFTGGRSETTAKLHSFMSESTMRALPGARDGSERDS